MNLTIVERNRVNFNQNYVFRPLKFELYPQISFSGNSFQGTLIEEEGRLNTVDLLALTSLDYVHFDFAKIMYFFTKQVTLMRRSTVLSLSLQLVDPVPSFRISF